MALVPVTEGRVGWIKSKSTSANPVKVAVLGSTGSIGTATLEVMQQFPERFSVVALSAGSNSVLLEKQIKAFSPKYCYLENHLKREELRGSTALQSNATVLFDREEQLLDLLRAGDIDLVVAAVVGFEGLPGVVAAIDGGALVALANKESLVSAGQLISDLLKEKKSALIPIDSEHSAIFQALQGELLDDISELVVTASGGPFRTLVADAFASITPAQALKHPTWTMGAKITIDSASMVNKALELAEAYWLFGVATKAISVLVHPQSIIHSLVNFRDGSAIAQLGVPDMKVPIAYALNYPNGRLPGIASRLNLAKLKTLEFFPLDSVKFRAPQLMLSSLDAGGVAPAVFTIANDMAVKAFLEQKITFDRIIPVIEVALARFGGSKYSSLSDLLSLRDTIYAELTV
jgi:1-deoxy-D-xylulose-5-phosphate reductoisomerase